MNNQNNDITPLEELKHIQGKYYKKAMSRDLHTYFDAYYYCLYEFNYDRDFNGITVKDSLKIDKICEQIFHIECVRKNGQECSDYRHRFIKINNHLYERK